MRTWGCNQNKARLVGGDVALDPVLILGHSGEAVRDLGRCTTFSAIETHQSSLDPLGFTFPHHWASYITLHRLNNMTSTLQENVNTKKTEIKCS